MSTASHGVAISLLCKLVDGSSRCDGLTSKKIYSRSKTSTPDPSRPNVVLLEVERHSAALGEIYVGAAMSAYYTYFMRFEVDVDTKAIKELEPSESTLTIENIGGLAETYLGDEIFGLHVVGTETGAYEIHEDCSHQSAVISSKEQAVEFALGFAYGNIDYFEMQLSNESNISQEDQSRILQRFTSAIEEALTRKGEKAWDDREEWS